MPKDSNLLIMGLERAFRGHEIVEEGAATERAEMIADVANIDLSTSEIHHVVRTFLLRKRVKIDQADVVSNSSTFRPWLDARRASPTYSSRRWDNYLELLHEKGRSETVLAELHHQTDKIVERMGDPTVPGNWKRRGLVMGDVQSGKTQTYIGSINKALDLGYKAVIIFGGHTDELRRQTQNRVDSDVIGDRRTPLGRELIGVGGRLDRHPPTQSLTSYESDFGARTGRTSRISIGGANDHPAVFVIKKHARIISQVADYIRSASGAKKINAPILVIDDESDWASVNTKETGDPTAVNAAIRALLASSTKSSYLAMTATPVANVLIDDSDADDLFPSDYIVSLKSPSNYHGAESYFSEGGRNLHHVIRDVEDAHHLLPVKHNKYARLDTLPESLITAIEAFVLAVSIRRTRETENFKSSMMINMSRFKDVQAGIRDLVADYVFDLRAAALSELALDLTYNSAIVTSLRNTFDAQYANAGTTWDELTSHIIDVLDTTDIALINGDTTDQRLKARRDLPAPMQEALDLQPRIYVGGDVLSRGLTLDGLIVSYFTRQAAASDTLLQMGRWFGYRDDFDDLVRVWISEYTATLFERTNLCLAELRESFTFMSEKGLTPRDYGIKVRIHPDSFLITARNKSLNARETAGIVSFYERTQESHRLPLDPNKLRANFDAVKGLVTRLSTSTTVSAEPANSQNEAAEVWRNVPLDLIADFFYDFHVHDAHPYLSPAQSESGLAPVIEHLLFGGVFTSCDVALVSLKRTKSVHQVDLGHDHTVIANRRSKWEHDSHIGLLSFPKRRVAAAGDLRSTAPDEVRAELAKLGLVSETAVMRAMSRPLLMIYTVVPDFSRLGSPESEPAPPGLTESTVISAFKIAVPRHPDGISGEIRDFQEGKGARYLLNSVAQRDRMAAPDTEDSLDDDYDE